MIVATLYRLALLGLLLSCGSPEAGRAADISKQDLAEVLRGAALPEPWHVNQLAYENNGTHWQVDLYYDPRQIGSRICIASLVITDINRKLQSYSIEDQLPPRRAVALEDCDHARKSGHFTDLADGISDQQLQVAVSTVFAISNHKRDLAVRFESENLISLLKRLRRNQLHWIEKSPTGNIVFGFFEREISPDMLAIRLGADGRRPAYVYRENGPDITSLRKR